MRLYLSSFLLGNDADALVRLVGPGGRVGLVLNALDNAPEARERFMASQTHVLTEMGFSVEELDLRRYFDTGAMLRSDLARFNLLWVNGGNAFLLRQAMRQSGLDAALPPLLAEDKIVYAGFSAAAVITGPTMQGLVPIPGFAPPTGYDPGLITEGLGITPYVVVVHHDSDHPGREQADWEKDYYERNRIPYRLLRDGEALVVEDGRIRLAGWPNAMSPEQRCDGTDCTSSPKLRAEKRTRKSIGPRPTKLENPLTDVGSLPRFGTIRPEHVRPAVDAVIAAHAGAISDCVKGTDFDTVFMAKERADAEMTRMWQLVSHLTMVADTPELRAAHQAAQPVLSAYTTSVGQNRMLYDAIAGIARDPLSPAKCRAIDLALRDFELLGVTLAPAERLRFADISIRLDALSTGFANAVMDATEAWTLNLTDPDQLGGIPDADRAMLAAQAEAKGLDGWVVDLHAASVQAVLNQADDRELRRTVYHAFVTRASDVGPDAGRFDNGARMDEILALRGQAAALLGFDTPVAWSLATKMADDADTVIAFLLDLAERARPQAQAELADLAAFASEKLGIAKLEPWDIGYAGEKLRLERHAIDRIAIKRHLPLPRVLDGLFALVEELYGVAIRPIDGVETWHPDVRYFELYRPRNGIAFAGIYCDFFARGGKNGGAWMDVCRPRLPAADATHMPIAFLNCNFAAAAAGEPAYLSHDDMITLFHEMGHCLHLVLTEVDMPSVGGISGVEWDAVELPSQLMENFAWDVAMLRQVSQQAETGEPLSFDLIDRIRGARRFLGGMALLRQVENSLFDIRLHLAAADPAGASVMDTLRAVRNEVSIVTMPEWNRFGHGFSHIFAGGYASGYYSYLWAERLSADAFEAFAECGADRPSLGAAFREHVLSRGGTRSATANFVAFRGREPESGALLRAWGLTG